MTAYKNRYSCRLCGGFELEKVLTLEPTPPANSFVNENDLSKKQSLYTLLSLFGFMGIKIRLKYF